MVELCISFVVVFLVFSDKTMMVWASGTFPNDCIKVNEEKILNDFWFCSIIIWIYLYLFISGQDTLCNNTGNVSILATG